MTAIKRLSRSLCLLFTALFVVLALGAALTVDTAAENLRYGSTGSKVREVQQLLKNWGYYTGSVDGIYGSKTRTKVVMEAESCTLKLSGERVYILLPDGSEIIKARHNVRWQQG